MLEILLGFVLLLFGFSEIIRLSREQSSGRRKKPAAQATDQTGWRIGAGEGNRTLVVSLGSFCSAIELRPPRQDPEIAQTVVA